MQKIYEPYSEVMGIYLPITSKRFGSVERIIQKKRLYDFIIPAEELRLYIVASQSVHLMYYYDTFVTRQ